MIEMPMVLVVKKCTYLWNYWW